MQGEVKGHRVKKGVWGTSQSSSIGMWTVTVCRRSLCVNSCCVQ